MGKGGGESTIGYNYFLGIHLIPCLACVRKLRALATDKKTFWQGTVTTDAQLAINSPNFFGGDPPEGQGGLSGFIDVMFGGPTQAVNDYLRDTLHAGQRVPAFRGVFSLVFRSFYWGNTGTIRPVKALVEGDPDPTSGFEPTSRYLTRADVEYEEMNPVHIIYHMITAPKWGMGYAPALVDTTSFAAAATQLKTENFAMSVKWVRQKKYTDMFKEIMKHINGEVYQDPYTGQWRMKLIRPEAVPANLPLIDKSNCELSKFKRTHSNNAANSMTVEYYDIKRDRIRTVNQDDMALIDRNGGRFVHVTNQYHFCSSTSLARELCARDLRESSTPLASITLKNVFPSVADGLLNGDAFRFTWAEEGCDETMFRVTKTNLGGVTDKSITIEAVEDIYAYGTVSQTDNDDNWEPVVTDPEPITIYQASTTFYPLASKFFSATLPNFADNEGAFIACARATPTDRSVTAWTSLNAGSYEQDTAVQNFAPWCDTDAAISETDTTIDYVVSADLDYTTGNFPLMGLIDDEIVKITAGDLSANTLTIERGCADTLPAAHNADTKLWVVDLTNVALYNDYTQGDILDVKLQAKNATGAIEDIGLLPVVNIPLTDRLSAPLSLASAASSNLDLSVVASSTTITAVERNRLTQNETLYSYYDATNVPAEAGQTVYARIYGVTSGFIREELITLPWVYDYATAQADKGANTQIAITLQTERSTLRSRVETLEMIHDV